jgi:dienelactone hydrolase
MSVGISDDAPVTHLIVLLRECNMTHLDEALGQTSLTELDAAHSKNYAALLALLKSSGVASMKERMAIGSAFAKAKKQERIQPDESSPPPPPPPPLGSQEQSAEQSAATQVEQPGQPPASATAAPPPRAGPEQLGRKPHVVFVHGNAQNIATFRQQVDDLAKRMAEIADVSFVQSSTPCRSDTVLYDGARQSGEQAIFDWAHAERYTGTDANAFFTEWHVVDWAAPLAELEAQLAPLARIDVLIGFCTGANLAAIAAARSAHGVPGSLPALRGLVLLEADQPLTRPGWAAAFPQLFRTKLLLPVLVAGASDEAFPRAGAADAVSALFASPRDCRYVGGHVPLPAASAAREQLVEDIAEFVCTSAFATMAKQRQIMGAARASQRRSIGEGARLAWDAGQRDSVRAPIKPRAVMRLFALSGIADHSLSLRPWAQNAPTWLEVRSCSL